MAQLVYKGMEIISFCIYQALAFEINNLHEENQVCNNEIPLVLT